MYFLRFEGSRKFIPANLVNQAIRESLSPRNLILKVGVRESLYPQNFLPIKGPPKGKRNGVIRHILQLEYVNWMKKIALQWNFSKADTIGTTK